MSYCHHLASVVCKLFQTLTRRTPEDLPHPNLAYLFISICATILSFGFLICQRTWPPWLKIEHRGKLQFFAYNSKMVTDIKFVQRIKSVQNLKIYLPWNFQEDPTTDVGVIALFLDFFIILHLFSLISWKLYKIFQKFKLHLIKHIKIYISCN